MKKPKTFIQKQDWRTFMPKDNITIKEIAKVIKLINLKIDFNVINVPKKMQKHFLKMEDEI